MFFWPSNYRYVFPPFLFLFGAAVVGLPLILWAVYSLWPHRPILETSTQGVILGLWVRRGVPWSNILNVRLSTIKVDGGLKKRWNASRPYRQSVVIELNNSSDLYFEDWLHRLAHFVSFSRKQIRLPLKLVMLKNNDDLCNELIERWQSAINTVADDNNAVTDHDGI